MMMMIDDDDDDDDDDWWHTNSLNRHNFYDRYNFLKL